MPVTYQSCKRCEIIFKVLDQRKIFHYLPGDMGGGFIMKKVTNGDVGERGSKIWHFRGDVLNE